MSTDVAPVIDRPASRRDPVAILRALPPEVSGHPVIAISGVSLGDIGTYAAVLVLTSGWEGTDKFATHWAVWADDRQPEAVAWWLWQGTYHPDFAGALDALISRARQDPRSILFGDR
jgi:hypothetical protein